MCTLLALYCSIKGSHSSFPFSSLHTPRHDGNTGTPQVTCCIGTEAQGCTQAPERQGKQKNVASRKRSLAEVLEERKANTPSLLPQQHSKAPPPPMAAPPNIFVTLTGAPPNDSVPPDRKGGLRARRVKWFTSSILLRPLLLPPQLRRTGCAPSLARRDEVWRSETTPPHQHYH